MAITLVQEQLFTAASPGLTWTNTMSSALTPGNMLLVALFTDATAVVTFSVDAAGSKGTSVTPALLTTGSGVLQLFLIQNLAQGSNATVTARWNSGPTNAAMRVHEYSPTLVGSSFLSGGGTGSTGAGPVTSSLTSATSVNGGIKVAALVCSVTSSSQSQTGADTWVSYSITAGARTAYYAVALNCTSSSSSYTWNLSSSGNFLSNIEGSATAAYAAPTPAASALPTVHPGYTKPVVGRGQVPVVTPYRRDYSGVDMPVVLGTRQISGHVYNSTGAAVSGATVKLVREFDDFEVASTTTDGSGAYTFTRDSRDVFTYYVIAYSVTGGSTQIHGTSDRDLVPQSDPTDQFTAIYETEF